MLTKKKIDHCSQKDLRICQNLFLVLEDFLKSAIEMADKNALSLECEFCLRCCAHVEECECRDHDYDDYDYDRLYDQWKDMKMEEKYNLNGDES
jgi:hypothetical protein